MSCSKWEWKPICDTRPCCGECDLCGYDDDNEEETYTISAESQTITLGFTDENY